MEKKKPNLFLRIIFSLFIIFIGLFIASESGYYETQLSKKVIMTDEAIQQFEADVASNQVIDIKNYIIEDTPDYSNSFTDAGEKITEVVENFIIDGIGGAWDVIKSLFW